MALDRPSHSNCAYCKYDLTGIEPGRRKFPCPECGKTHDRASDPGVVPFRGGLVMSRVCWPCWIAVMTWAAYVTLSIAWRSVNDGPYFAISVLTLLSAVASPWYMAARLVKRYLPRNERFIPHLVLGIVGVIINLLTWALAAFVLHRWL